MKKILYSLLLSALFFSCSSDLEDLNRNTKDPSEVSGESLFTGGQNALVNQMLQINVNFNNTNLWAQYFQETTYTDESNYDQVTRTIPDNHWNVIYLAIKDLHESARIITETDYVSGEDIANKPNKLAIVEILTVYAYANLVETFGNVPYSETLELDNLLPAYDDAETIYKDLIRRLSEAVNTLDESKGSFGRADVIYRGDVTLWKKFGNSLKLRMGILLSDADTNLAKITVEEAVNNGVFTSNADNALYAYQEFAPNTNPLYASLVLSGRHDFVAAETIINILTGLDDPRLPLYFLPTDDGSYKGGVIGNGSPYSDFSHVAPILETPTFPGNILDYAEVEFLLAEASARSFNVGGSAREHYEKGITASILYWGGTVLDAADYLSNPAVDYDLAIAASSAAVPWKEVIGTQKYIALYTRGFEAWTSIRLLDFPLMAEPVDAVSGYPVRYIYPIAEQTLNGDHYNAASTAIGGDKAETKLFWDMN
ncbi:SusD/RagB family nutrient-binding outer membrane lipoprotein [Sinomicrobium weinanense]|uniref:SusD/RagB family nutrient-binding outer membrane lipoprotein n=1 Tax=Sinomicrobium weinanense TaxID=2842200 RepID=A0A926JVH0_9FLAO|nr:SusD/RagB family nutrient-binding outer membrane lipoprotein [Sinomicrobium weinanense]MBC9798230.1 SusD/RagB family nutrient-binding outer membrane lipoprotein [Sinomicrobium weinanense]MBU3125322.1 SusD/RagB family nutrient-binding outer membrane lipoprotein [Sinomicrobium weinanense]